MRREINIQDAVLFNLLRENAPVSLAMMTGRVMEGRIVRFDRYCLILEDKGGNVRTLIYKHALASVTGLTTQVTSPPPRQPAVARSVVSTRR